MSLNLRSYASNIKSVISEHTLRIKFVVVNLDDLAQASDIQIERR